MTMKFKAGDVVLIIKTDEMFGKVRCIESVCKVRTSPYMIKDEQGMTR